MSTKVAVISRARLLNLGDLDKPVRHEFSNYGVATGAVPPLFVLTTRHAHRAFLDLNGKTTIRTLLDIAIAHRLAPVTSLSPKMIANLRDVRGANHGTH